jgi:hypothetical protein
MTTTVKVRGWTITRTTRVVDRADPTLATTYALRSPRHPQIEVVAVWGYDIRAGGERLFTEDERVASRALRYAGAPTLDAIDRACDEHEAVDHGFYGGV